MTVATEIIYACVKRDRRSQFKLYEICYPYMMSIARRYKAYEPDAAAAVNIAFLHILNKIEQYKEIMPFKNWIRKIMINTIIDEFRKEKKHRAIDYPKELENTLNGNANYSELNIAETNIDAEQLVSFIHLLPVTAARVFNLFVLDGYSHKEIGDLLNISESNSKWHLFQARKSLQEKVTQFNQNEMNRISFTKMH